MNRTSCCTSPVYASPLFAIWSPAAFLVQSVTTFAAVRALHRARAEGRFQSEAFTRALGGLLRWLGHFWEE